jgi:transposase InsO family protein
LNRRAVKSFGRSISPHGVPSKVISDNGPQFFSSDFADFAKTYEFVHVTSSPGYPQLNGQTENAVKNVKRNSQLLRDSSCSEIQPNQLRVSPMDDRVSRVVLTALLLVHFDIRCKMHNF